MKITPLAADSLGARSMATLVETPDVTVLLDPSVRLGPYRYDLRPHPTEETRQRELWQRIREASKSADVLTVSIHQERNYPVPKPRSHIDVGLPDGTTDAEYLRALEAPLSRCVGFAPDALFYLAGADPFEHDRLGGLALSRAGLAERDRRVFQAAADAAVPVAVTLAGGYAEFPADTVAIHVDTVRAAATVFAGAVPR